MRTYIHALTVALIVLGLFVPTVLAEDEIHNSDAKLAPMWEKQSPTVAWWASDIYRWAKAYRLNPNIVATLMQLESCGLPEARSSSAAQGLFQVMPFNFPKEYEGRMQDPEINAEVGINYFNYVLEKSGGNLPMAFAAYNGGPSKLSTPMQLWPDETKRYYYWSFMAEGAMSGASESTRLAEWLAVGKSMCDSARVWQDAHPHDPTSRRVSISGPIVIDLPPSVWVFVFLVAGALIARKNKNIGNGLVWVVTVGAVVIWFPVNLRSDSSRAYTNVVFELRTWYDQNKDIAKVIDYVRKGQSVGLPVPGPVDSAMALYENSNAFVLDVSLWVSRDPILTPIANAVSSLVWPALHGQPRQIVSMPLTAPFREPVQVRVVQDGRGAVNPFGLHGNFCFRCVGLRSWLGTDVVMLPQQRVYAPVAGVVERVIVDGGQDVGGSSVWITSKTVRFAVLHLLSDDAKEFHMGDIVFAGQALGRQSPIDGHIHVIIEVQNPDGSWADYPLLLVLEQSGIPYVWYDRRWTYTDLYVPTTREMTEPSVYLKEVIPNP